LKTDGVTSEFLKNARDKTLNKLYELICDIYSTGKIPSYFKRNVIIPIIRKKKAERCKEYRTISLTIHASQ
jgi:hypothetical protein